MLSNALARQPRSRPSAGARERREPRTRRDILVGLSINTWARPPCQTHESYLETSIVVRGRVLGSRRRTPALFERCHCGMFLTEAPGCLQECVCNHTLVHTLPEGWITLYAPVKATSLILRLLHNRITVLGKHFSEKELHGLYEKDLETITRTAYSSAHRVCGEGALSTSSPRN